MLPIIGVHTLVTSVMYGHILYTNLYVCELLYPINPCLQPLHVATLQNYVNLRTIYVLHFFSHVVFMINIKRRNASSSTNVRYFISFTGVKAQIRN